MTTHRGDRYDLLVVGSANADLVIRVERRPRSGETVLGSELAVYAGGKGANQALAAARLGARTALLARVGDDEHGRLLLRSQADAGVDTGAVLVGGAATGVALITVERGGDNGIVVSPGANALLSPEDIAAADALAGAARVLCVQLEIPLPTAVAAVRAAARHGTRAVVNASPPVPLPDDVLAACDPLVVNEHEALALLGRPPGAGGAPPEWAAALLATGPRAVVVTLGPAGAVAADASGTVHIPSPAVRAVDTTGAGDAFTGALAWRLSRGEDLAGAVRYAVRAGAAAVTRVGAQDSFPTAAELPVC